MRCVKGRVPDSKAEMGFSIVSPGEMRGQIECALANIDQSLLGIQRLFPPDLLVEIEATAAE